MSLNDSVLDLAAPILLKSKLGQPRMYGFRDARGIEHHSRSELRKIRSAFWTNHLRIYLVNLVPLRYVSIDTEL